MINKDDIITTEFYKYASGKLLNRNLDKAELIGLVSLLIYSKDIFKSNKDIKPFIELLFEYNYPDYIMKSRTLIVAKSSRYMNDMDNETLNNIHKKISIYLNIKSTTNQQSRLTNNKKSYDKLNTWLKGI